MSVKFGLPEPSAEKLQPFLPKTFDDRSSYWSDEMYAASDLNGIGEYDQQHYNENRVRLQAARISQVCLCVLLNAFIISSALVVVHFVPLAMVVFVPVELVAFLYSLEQIRGMCLCEGSLAPSMRLLGYDRELERQGLPKVGSWTDVDATYIFKDCREASIAKLEMIRNAKQEVLISGSYCGRAAFKEMLEVIDESLEVNEELKVFVITGTRFVTDKDGFHNWEMIHALTEKYPDRFLLTLSFESVQEDIHKPGGFKYVSNHAKMVIGDGKAAIFGGSAVEDRWRFSDGTFPHYYPGETGVVNTSFAKAFRDKDVCFFGGDILRTSRFEFYKLFTRWHHYCMTHKVEHHQFKQIIENRTTADVHLGPLHDFHREIDPARHLSLQSMNLDEARVHGPEGQRVKMTVSGPEMTKNTFAEELIRQIEHAQEEIILSHFYIHPTTLVMDALKRALDRGVMIKIYTNKFDETSPNAHRLFAPRSMYQIRDLCGYQDRDNLQVHFWNSGNSSFHQKAVVFDRKIVSIGSSNFSPKGLETMADYELDVFIQSEKAALDVIGDLDADVAAGRFDEAEMSEITKRAGFIETLTTWVHMAGSRKWG